MTRFNGIAVAQAGAGWEALKAMYPAKKAIELDLKVCKGLERTADGLGQKFDESIYGLELREVADYLNVDFDVMIMFMLGRWSRPTAEKLAGLVIIGDGDCVNCGGDLEFFDYGKAWGCADIYRCELCGTEQFKQ